MPVGRTSRIAALLSVALAACAAVSAPGGAAAPGPEDSRASIPRAASVDLHIDGRGFGHGRGMSQYGAQGRALEGQSAGHILDVYYPGTRVGVTRGRIRILLSTPATRGLVVGAKPRLLVRRVATGARWRLPDLPGLTQWRLRWTSGHSTTLEMHRRGSWEPSPRKRWRSIDGAAELIGGGPVELFRAGAPTAYRGALRTYSGNPDAMSVVNVLRMNKYLFGVVPRESPASWQPAALQAQAVAARTYAQFHRQRARDGSAGQGGYDLCDTTSCQVYGGRGDEVATTNAAVRASGGAIRTWRGEPIIAEYSSSNGGQSVGTTLPYQRFRTDRFDRWSGNPNRSWSTIVDGGRVAEIWGLGRLTGVRAVTRDGHGKWGGRVDTLRLVGTKRTVTVSGDTLRLAFGLRSTYLRVRVV